jgi:hypothetical protein
MCLWCLRHKPVAASLLGQYLASILHSLTWPVYCTLWATYCTLWLGQYTALSELLTALSDLASILHSQSYLLHSLTWPVYCTLWATYCTLWLLQLLCTTSGCCSVSHWLQRKWPKSPKTLYMSIIHVFIALNFKIILFLWCNAMFVLMSRKYMLHSFPRQRVNTEVTVPPKHW